MSRKLLHLARNKRGNSAIELALVAPILAALVIGVTDLSNGYSAKLLLEQAAQRSIEKAMQGKKQLSMFDSLKVEGATAADVPLANVTVKYWLECNGVNQNSSPATMAADYEKVCPSGQIYARYVTVEITKKYKPSFKAPWPGLGADGQFTLTGKSGIRVQ